MKFLAFFLTVGLLITGLNSSLPDDRVITTPDENAEIAANPCNPRIRKCT